MGSPTKGNFTITNKTRGNPPFGGLPLSEMKEVILGKDYDLSLVFVSDEESRALNREYRKKDEPTDILSFPLSKRVGEIFICQSAAKVEAKKIERSWPNFLAFLFIHGCCHLKGLSHSSRMEHEEEKFRRKFGI